MRALLPVIAFGVVVAACGVDASRESVGRTQQAIVNGTTDSTDSAVVMLLIKKTKFPAPFEWCSGVVVSPHVVATAAHCIDPAEIESGATLSIYVGDSYVYGQPVPPPSALFAIRETHMVPDFSLATVPTMGRDFGVVITNDPLPVTPLAMNRDALDASLVGQPVRVVGFGNSVASNNNSAGTRYAVQLPITAVNDKFIVEKSGDASTCGGDSGGATFLAKDGHDVLVGIHAATMGSGPCTGPDYDTRIDLYATSFVDPFIAQFDAVADAGSDASPEDASVVPSPKAPSASGCSTAGTRRPADGSIAYLVAALLAAAFLRKRSRQ